MKIISKGLKKCYIMHSTTTGEYMICKVLNDYDNKKEADDDMVKLLAREISEKDLLKEFSKKPY
jgi:predicted Mrr-cat superfamily restriction endonuclease